MGQMLPQMRARGAGALLLTTGLSAAIAAPFLANVGVTIASAIVPGGEVTDPDAIGRIVPLSHHQARPPARTVFG
ncbi:hypothetical protein ABT168_07015 [Streptomyces sp. NPDC001793]|uniref:hypothetical protein n=1 Tax=Streptomyces sp. NPDC001793 TaxID=3154657 RepID=UPI0033292622